MHNASLRVVVVVVVVVVVGSQSHNLGWHVHVFLPQSGLLRNNTILRNVSSVQIRTITSTAVTSLSLSVNY